MWQLDQSGKWIEHECRFEVTYLLVLNVLRNGKIVCVGRRDLEHPFDIWVIAEFCKGEWVCKIIDPPVSPLLENQLEGWIWSFDTDSRLRLWEPDLKNGWKPILVGCSQAISNELLFISEDSASIFPGFPVGAYSGHWHGGTQWKVKAHDDERIFSHGFLPDGRVISTIQGLELWKKVSEGEWEPTQIALPEHVNEESQVDFLPDGRLLSTHGSTLQILEPNGDGIWSINELKGHTSEIKDVIFLSDGSIQSRSEMEVFRWGNDQHLRPDPVSPSFRQRWNAWWQRR